MWMFKEVSSEWIRNMLLVDSYTAKIDAIVTIVYAKNDKYEIPNTEQPIDQKL